jgi:lactate dehydrogenase-like 2-hydroxyacid dehydrogenase
MDAKKNGAALLAAAQGKVGELDALLETLDERELATAILHVANVQNVSKRELFAAMAMQGMCASDFYATATGEHIAADATDCADALLAALAREGTP